jgi:hypothetical protein
MYIKRGKTKQNNGETRLKMIEKCIKTFEKNKKVKRASDRKPSERQSKVCAAIRERFFGKK